MSSIEEAKRIVRSHEKAVAAQDMSAILSNMADDSVFLAPDVPLVEGHDSLQALYEDMFAIGDWEFGHDYSDASEVGDLVFLHGVARGTLTPNNGDPSPFANNFMITMRKTPRAD